MTGVTELVVPLSANPYPVRVGAGLLAGLGGFFTAELGARRCVLVTDSNVEPLYAEVAENSLAAGGCESARIVVPAGEASKSMDQVSALCEAMVEAGFDRQSAVVALGGGVVGDLAGFVAAIFQRGIPVVQVPTSIVAQVDSAIGGKTGVNARSGKNLIGAFHQPSLVLCDTDTLATLPLRERNEGMAEVIKHAAIRDPAMLDSLEDIPALIARNVGIKAAIVAEDEFETKGLRALLNFGHTIGHGIESAAGYGRFLHGEAISLGLAAACDLSVRHAGLAPSCSRRVLEALRSFSLPVELPGDVETEAIMHALRKDKKFSAGRVRFVLLRALGDAFVSKDVCEDDLVAAIERLRARP